MPGEVDALGKRAGGLAASVPVPVPRPAEVWIIDPTHDPDDDVREAARAEVIAGSGAWPK